MNDSAMPSPQEREAALFALAIGKPLGERVAFLQAVCGSDNALRQRLEALLAAHEQPNDALTTAGPPADAAMKTEFVDEPVGRTIGRYKLLEKMGEGGCGVVYVAEQTEPVRRRIALKVIKLGMDTKAVVARFEAERQALAMMDHPNIAKVLDAGATDTGRPYFVMELVRGIKITDYCDQERLGTRERLDLFIKVCQAIQHAHQKGIIHRDIKPSNILVTLHDGVPVPKVIDFGIAKATEGRLTDATVYTQLHQFIGTPAYMSPEQAEMSGLDIDTRSDIYSLGVLLYELLTGRTPFDAQELMSQGIDAMRRTIREKEPVRPSTRLATLKRDELTTTAKRRSAEAPKLIHLLKGDLDWIVMKCLEKDRQRRYETANGLAADLKRHLSNETVLARPPSAAYRFQKAFRRNKLAFAAGTSIAAALILGVVGTTIGLLRANRAGTLALQSRHEAEKLAIFMLDDLYAELEPSGQFESVARLARQTVAYYDQLPPSLRTAETDRNRVMARARLALILSRQADIKSAQPLADETVSRIGRTPEKDRSEGMVFALGLALEAQYFCYFVQFSSRLQLAEFEQSIATLRPLAIAADGSRRVKLQYANVLNYLSHLQPPERGVMTCGEARGILAGIGALDLSDLNAATAWADVADSEARLSMGIGRLDEAERLEKQVQSLTERVLKIRAGDLRARRNLFFAADMLTLIAARRFQDGEALRWATQARQAAEESHRFNPSDSMAIDSLLFSHYALASLSFRSGRVAEALEKAMETVRTLTDPGKTGNYMSRLDNVWAAMAGWEAQRGNREAADQAIQQARRFLDSFASKVQMEEQTKAGHRELIDAAERQLQLAFGDDARALATATAALPRIEEAKQRAPSAYAAFAELFYQRGALGQATLAALKLGRLADAERTARALISLPLPTTEMPTRMAIDQPDDLGWAQVLLAQSLVGQGRQAEALVALQPALALYREMKGQGATYLTFHQHFARALYVQGLAQSNDAAGTAQRRDSLAAAAKVLIELSEEARQLRDTKELLSWITAAQRPDAQVKQP